MRRSVLSYLEESATRCPDRIYLRDDQTHLTFSETLQRVRAIGTAIAARVSPRQPVAVLADKGVSCVLAMLGAVCAGCFYTPIDPAMPEKRRMLILDTLQPALVLADRRHAAKVPDGLPCLVPDEIDAYIDEETLTSIRREQIDTDLLYVLFTSGSTGVPKGVAVRHRSVIDYIDWAMAHLHIPEGCCFGNQAPLYFDNSVLDLYGAMAAGACVYLIGNALFAFPTRLLERLRENRVDTLFWVPSALQGFLNAGVLTADALELKRIWFCGEVMPVRVLNGYRALYPDADYVNMYGPTEITDVCAWYRVDRDFNDAEPLPIGYPCENTRITLVDGELCVSGTCLAAGYYNAPELTARAFVDDGHMGIMYKTGDLGAYNDRGELMYLGRLDSQIKRRGYRIELGEIETALLNCEGISAGCVLFDGERIHAVYTGVADEKQLKKQLKLAISSYMLPDDYHRMDSLPHTLSGKIDRQQLRKLVIA